MRIILCCTAVVMLSVTANAQNYSSFFQDRVDFQTNYRPSDLPPKVASDKLQTCYATSILALDDGISDALTIAKGTIRECTPERALLMNSRMVAEKKYSGETGVSIELTRHFEADLADVSVIILKHRVKKAALKK